MNIVLPHFFNMALECLFRSRPHVDGETSGTIADWHLYVHRDPDV